MKKTKKTAIKTKYTAREDGRIVHTITIDGKRKYFYGASDKEVEKKMLAYTRARSVGRTFAEVADEWQAAHDTAVNVSTARAYAYPTRRIIEFIGDVPIKDIEPQRIKAHLSKLSAQGYSAKVVRRYLSIYRQIFDHAAEAGDISVNAARNVQPPKLKAPATREPATPEEERIIAANAGEFLLPYFILMTGCRRGEALAIQFKDIDRVKKVIRVYKAVQCDRSGHPQIVPPKTDAGVRTVPLLDDLAAVLPAGAPEAYLFGGEAPLGSNAFNRYWERFKASTGVSATAHQLRHSYATMLYEAGVDIKLAASIIGHSDESLTARLYEHIRDSRQAEAAEMLNAYYRNKIIK